MAWDAESDSNSPAVKGGTGDALFQPEQASLSYMFYNCLLMVLFSSSGEFRMCGTEGKIWGEGAGERREVVVPACPPPTS